MRKNEQNETEIVIDIKHIIAVLLKFAWLIAVVGILAGTVTFAYFSNYVTPKYASSVMLYVNNKSLSVSGSISISAADLSASQSLIDTYMVILNNRTTMEEVIERAEVDYTPAQLKSMISSHKMEGTEIFTVTVTSHDPYEAAHIANCISEVLPHRIEDIIDGSSMRIVDSAVVNLRKVSPDISGKTMRAIIIACMGTAALVVLLSFFDDTIRDESFLTENYDLPILSRIPDLKASASHSKRGYGYYYKSRNTEGRKD